MANTYKNIVITPNQSTVANVVPEVRFSAGDQYSNTDIYLRTYTTSNGTVTFEGSAGQLFSITNDFSNTIFSVNDVSGIPSIEVKANGDIELAQYGGKVKVNGSPVSNSVSINCVIDGGGAAITTGQRGFIEVPFNCILDSWSIYLDATDNIDIEIWKTTYANFPPTSANTINTGTYQVVTDIRAQGSVFDVTDTINAGDILVFNVSTVSTATLATMSLKATKI